MILGAAPSDEPYQVLSREKLYLIAAGIRTRDIWFTIGNRSRHLSSLSH